MAVDVVCYANTLFPQVRECSLCVMHQAPQATVEFTGTPDSVCKLCAAQPRVDRLQNQQVPSAQVAKFLIIARPEIESRLVEGKLICTDVQGRPSSWLRSAVEQSGIEAGKLPRNVTFEITAGSVTVTADGKSSVLCQI